MEYYAFRSLKPINSRSGQNKAVICFKIPYIAASPIVVGMLKIKFMFGPLCRVQRLPPRLTLLQVCQYFLYLKRVLCSQILHFLCMAVHGNVCFSTSFAFSFYFFCKTVAGWDAKKMEKDKKK